MRSLKTVFIIILSTYIFSFAAHSEGTPIRTYCFYVPKASIKLNDKDEIIWPTQVTKYQKLMQPNNTKDTYVVNATFRDKKDFAVTEAQFTDLFTRCKAQLQNAGEDPKALWGLKATDREYYETLTRFYPLGVLNVKQELGLGLEEGKIPEVGMLKDTKPPEKSALNENEIEELVKANPEKLQELANNLDQKKLEQVVADVNKNPSTQTLYQKIGSALYLAATNKYSLTALGVAATVASIWFAPAYLAAGTEYLYPIIYGALYGVPSPYSLSYWLIYLPGKFHAVAWTYNYSQVILGSAYTAIGGLYALFAKTPTKEKAKEELGAAVEKLKEVKEEKK